MKGRFVLFDWMINKYLKFFKFLVKKKYIWNFLIIDGVCFLGMLGFLKCSGLK